jgi:hypothetical protein
MAKKLNDLTNALQGYAQDEARKILEREGRRLKYLALKMWRKDMEQYQPKQYAVHLGMPRGKRTKRSQRAIKLGKVKMLPDGSMGIELTWENELVYHDSMFKGQPKGHSVMLISDGWHSRKLEAKLGRKVERFTYFEGTNYLYRLYKEYMKIAPQGILLDVQWSGKYTQR